MKTFLSCPFGGILKFPFYRRSAGTGLPCIVFCITVAHPDRRSQNLSIKLVNDPIVWEVGVEMEWEQRVYLTKKKKKGKCNLTRLKLTEMDQSKQRHLKAFVS